MSISVQERLSDAQVWEALIPHMGYAALLRNLRNFDQAAIPDNVAAKVIDRLTDPDEVARSRQLPFRFLSAYREAPSLRWGHALEVALGHACRNIPSFPGRTAILCDTSASMTDTVSAKSKIKRVDVGALFGVALAARGSDVTLCGFADGLFHHSLQPGGSVLKQTQAFTDRIGEVGHGTQALEAVAAVLSAAPQTGSKAPLRRIVLISDMQTMNARRGTWYWMRNPGQHNDTVSALVPKHINLFGWDLAGYANTQIDTSKPGRFELGGFSDRCFTIMSMLDQGIGSGFPWENTNA
jgi:hypothetical protein